MIADLVILLVLLVALYIGLSRGLVGPIFGEGAFVIALILVLRFHSVTDFVPSGGLRLVVILLFTFLLAWIIGRLARPIAFALRRTPLVGRIDEPVGAAVHLLLAAVLIYLGLGLVLDFDRSVYPMLKAGAATAQQIAEYHRQARTEPLAGNYVDDHKLDQAQASANSKPLPFDALERLDGFLDFYVKEIRTPLLSSRLAPIINRLGAQIPVIGHRRPYLAGASPG